MACLFKAAGADVIDCSIGQVSKAEQPVYAACFRCPSRTASGMRLAFAPSPSKYIRDVNTIIAAGRADLCAIARPHLADPAWTLHEGAKQGYADIWWPQLYVGGKQQLERNLARIALLKLQV